MYHYTSKLYAKEILDEIEGSNIIISNRKKNIAFLKRYCLLQSDVEEIIYSLKQEYFVERRTNINSGIKSEYVYIFKPIIELSDIYGKMLNYVYIKICKIAVGIFVISIHEDDD